MICQSRYLSVEKIGTCHRMLQDGSDQVWNPREKTYSQRTCAPLWENREGWNYSLNKRYITEGWNIFPIKRLILLGKCTLFYSTPTGADYVHNLHFVPDTFAFDFSWKKKSQQSLGNSRKYVCLLRKDGCRTILQMTRTAPQDKDILRHNEKRCPYSNQCGDHHLLSHSYCPTRYAIETFNLWSFTDSKYLSNGQN